MAFGLVIDTDEVKLGVVAGIVADELEAVVEDGTPLTVLPILAHDRIVRGGGNPNAGLVIILHKALFDRAEEVSLARAITKKRPGFDILVTFSHTEPWGGDGMILP